MTKMTKRCNTCNKEQKNSAQAPIIVPNCYELVEQHIQQHIQQQDAQLCQQGCGGQAETNETQPLIAMQFCGQLVKRQPREEEELPSCCTGLEKRKPSLSDIPTCYQLVGQMAHVDKKDAQKSSRCSNADAPPTCTHHQLQLEQPLVCCPAGRKEEEVLSSPLCSRDPNVEPTPTYYTLLKQQLDLGQDAVLPTNLKFCDEMATDKEKEMLKPKKCQNMQQEPEPTFFELVAQKVQRDEQEIKQPIIPMTFCCELAKKKEQEVFAVISKALQLFKHNEVFLSFNGGKDCTVLLHMLVKYFNSAALREARLPVLYIKGENRFPELDEFVRSCCKRYPNIDLIECSGAIKTALTEFCSKNPHLKAVFMGSRRTDPYCANLKEIHASDPGWPPLMRINPILDWTCQEVWNYMFSREVKYCHLYDLGYTSLGDTTNTKRNPHLQYVDPDTCEVKYMPAYALPDDDTLERAGRNCNCYC